MESRKKNYIFPIFMMILLTISVLLVNIFIGSSDISVRETLQIFFLKNKGSVNYDILWKIRMPRALASMLLGGALSLSGYLLQTFFHNPIAGPFVLGVSSGAKLTVAVSMMFFMSAGIGMSASSMVVSAFAGSMISLGFVLLVSRKIKRMSMLVVCGIMISYICSAITDFIVTFANDSDIVNLHDWSLGTFSGTNMNDVLVILIFVTVSVIGTVMISKPMGAYMLGENYAGSMGVNVKFLKVMIVVLSGLLSATVTAFAGPVSFVGIAVPHIARVVFRTSKPLVMIPCCFLGGSIFCMVCDMIARTALAPTEISISTVTAIFGAPVVIVAMLRRRQGEL
ncbi:MAG: iron ABC transporter permease [Oscillospiraceae bacterium]|nr:iron ABC transporter permease [Oscillospiraceae bacterium]